MIRVLIVEDSAAMRELLVRLFTADSRFVVAGTAGDGEEAVALAAQLRPDVITMDIGLPRMDGVMATRRIMAGTPTPIVVVSAQVGAREQGVAFEALQAGAVTVLDKPPGPGDPRHAPAAAELLNTVRLMAGVKVVGRRTPDGPGAVDPGPAATRRAVRPELIALAASTGGPQAIQALLQALDGGLDVPVLVVQHMAAGFLEGMAGWLAATCPQAVRLAAQGDEPAGGAVYLAPDGYHLVVTRRRTLALSKAPPVRGFRPSADTLFESVAESYGARAVGVVLTGMGEDGAAGLARLRAAGGPTIAQDEASSVVYGMPRAAMACGAAERALPLSAIGPAIRGLLGLEPRSTPRREHAS